MEPKECVSTTTVETKQPHIVHIQHGSACKICSVSKSVPLETQHRCPVFMLIIGINEYRSEGIPNLTGCVNDAHNIKKHFTDLFSIPEAQIAFLVNEQATHENIIERFQAHLIHNESIQKNDKIIIYYAGHGSRVIAPDSWPSGPDGKIETLVPHDERGINWKGDFVHGIPDLTIHALLGTLAAAKGNNITVFLDCCHSASGTREIPGIPLPVSRGVETLQPIPKELDQRFLRRCSVEVDSLPETRYKQFDSHVLLAACGVNEKAYEMTSAAGQPCGYFTNHLIEQLRRIGSNPITYADLMARLPANPRQNPHCEGINRNRYMFEVEDPAHDLKTNVKEDGTIEISLGSSHGVAIGTQFVVAMEGLGGQDLHHFLVARSVSQHSSILLPVEDVVDLASLHGAKVVVADGKNRVVIMKVYVHASGGRSLAIQDVPVGGRRRYFLLVDSIHDADLVVRRTSDEAFSFTRMDAKMTSFSIPNARLNVPLTRLSHVLDAMAHFNYFLGKNGNAALADNVTLDMYDLCWGAESNLVDDNEVQLPQDGQGKYGFTICNYSQYDLFPYLLRFDPMSYSIEALHLPQSTTVASLLAKSGPKPAQVTVGGGHTFHDKAFLKLFVSTECLDFGRICQPAAVDVMRDAHGEQCFAVDGKMWGAVDVAVTHRAKRSQ